MTIQRTGVFVKSYEGEGLQRVVESGAWFVGIKNWKPANDISEFDNIERHMLTDEVFVLLEGACTLLVDYSVKHDASDLRCVKMARNQVYCIPAGVWHNTITTKAVKLILMENIETSGENSEVRTLTESELATLRASLKPTLE